MLVEPIGHLGAVFSHLDLLYSLKISMWEAYAAPYMPDKRAPEPPCALL
ncbi:hypothetical protein JOC94_001108 [Bacillus thermophilus]|uniref:Uncharacterized protein n=1 Tax=Siminovitchia thermophila TaxID=1245522 RepID=A0ABS2R6A0_9BACI|nr:hypothetical protein [Siminovitchia thermophila]